MHPSCIVSEIECFLFTFSICYSIAMIFCCFRHTLYDDFWPICYLRDVINHRASDRQQLEVRVNYHCICITKKNREREIFSKLNTKKSLHKKTKTKQKMNITNL